MILHPLILSLSVASLLTCFMLLYSATFGIQILKDWDLQSGSETQLLLERKTYLVSSFLACLFGAQLLSFFLYIFTADHLHTLFVGAMCAAGSLHVNQYGYPTLILKTLNFLGAALWLILNHVDRSGYDYPLVKIKYGALLWMTPFILGEAVLQANYFLRLQPDIITSCCGSLFGTASGGMGSELSALPVLPMKILFSLSILLSLTSGLSYYRRRRGAYFLTFSSGASLVVSILSILSFISPYFYELPTHHCPFCLLQREYGHIGYPLYLTLFGGALSGVAVGMIDPFRKIASLSDAIPGIQRKLSLASVLLFLAFTAIVLVGILRSGLVLE